MSPEQIEVPNPPSEDLIKETYAKFGLAYYLSEVLHRSLCVVYAMLTFDKKEDATRPRIEEKISLAFSLTLGQLIGELKHPFEELLPEEISLRLDDALAKRKFLAHHFWYERIHLMYDAQDVLTLIEELDAYADLFDKLEQEISAYFMPRFSQFGITDGLLQERLAKLKAGDVEEPLITQRRPKKRELILRAWDVNVPDIIGYHVQVFESDDGCLWQLCDVGLGWTRFESVTPDWKINEAIQRYLPANINPRPEILGPWNYDFQLAKGATLKIRRNHGEKAYSWDINPLKK
ncbi:MAG: hypothetical protein K8J31_30215 [Anaerolineae bacterium]|nr:hypothetical protein [Anaerolineae bacterium]